MNRMTVNNLTDAESDALIKRAVAEAPVTSVVYVTVHGPTDMEGRGPDVTDKVFRHAADAEAYINSKSKGAFAPEWKIQTLTVYEGPFTPAHEAHEAKLTALKKVRGLLSPAELEALGLS